MSIDRHLAEVLVQIPECPEPLAQLYLMRAAEDIMQKLDALEEWLVPLRTQAGYRKYPLDVCVSGLRVKAVRQVTLDGQPLRGYRVVGDTLILGEEPGDYQLLQIKVALQADGTQIPAVLAAFGGGLIAWALWHLLRIQQQLWYNPTLADDFRREYLREKLLFESELDEQQQAAATEYARLRSPMGFI